MIENDVKVKKMGVNEDEVPDTRKIRRTGNLYAGGCTSKPTSLSYTASICTSNKHNGVAP